MMNFIEKQAKKPFKNIGFLKGKKSTGDREGLFTPPNPKDVRLYDKEELKQADIENIKKKGFTPVGDALLWGVGKIPKKGPELKKKTTDFLADKKRAISEADAHFSGKVKDALGVKRGGLIDRFTSKKQQVPIGEVIVDGKGQKVVLPNERIDSFGAPITNTTKVALPMLGAGKLMEMTSIENPDQNRTAKNDDVREQLAYAIEEGLLKEAALDKISSLEQELTRKETMIKVAKHERDVLLNDSLRYQDESDFYKRAYEEASKELEKISSTINRIKEKEDLEKRTKRASDLSEKLLERGIIKQANVEEFQELLRTCDDKTFDVFDKIASDSEKGLEKELYIIDDIDKTAHKYASEEGEVLSSTGQTMAEAVADLLK